MTIKMVNDKLLINGKVNIIAPGLVSNGIVHAIDEVLTPSNNLSRYACLGRNFQGRPPLFAGLVDKR
jgi:hypothetical protein